MLLDTSSALKARGGGAPPPAYETAIGQTSAGSPSPCGLSSAIWLSILNHLVHPRLSKEDQAIGRLELHRNVRFVCRDFYLVSMHLLRSHYLADYIRQVRKPYTTNPYPNSDWRTPPRRETEILDIFISLATKAEAELWESSLFISNDGYEDLFAHHQPRARLEDLVVGQGNQRGLVYPACREKWQGVVAEDVKVDLRFKSAALRLTTATPSHALRTIVEVTRSRDENLETTSRHLLDSLSRLSLARHQGLRGRTYQILY